MLIAYSVTGLITDNWSDCIEASDSNSKDCSMCHHDINYVSWCDIYAWTISNIDSLSVSLSASENKSVHG